MCIMKNMHAGISRGFFFFFGIEINSFNSIFNYFFLLSSNLPKKGDMVSWLHLFTH